jgi:hypothetical protein
MKFQNLDELYTYLRDKLLQKAKEKPTLIWRLQRHIEDDSYRNIETQSLSIIIVCGNEVYENELYRIQESVIDKELEQIDKVLETEEFSIEGFEQGRVVHSIIDKEVGNGGYPHDFLLKTLKFICEEKEKDKKFVCEGEGEQND